MQFQSVVGKFYSCENIGSDLEVLSVMCIGQNFSSPVLLRFCESLYVGCVTSMAVLRVAKFFYTSCLQVDQRILKAIAIEHSKDVDSAVVTVLDEVMPSMTGSMGALSSHHEAMPFTTDSTGNLFVNSTREVGSSSSAGECED